MPASIEKSLKLVCDIMSLLCSGANAPLQSRNNSDIMRISEIIAALYHLYQLYHYYFNYFVLYQTIFLLNHFLKEKLLLLFHLYILYQLYDTYTLYVLYVLYVL